MRLALDSVSPHLQVPAVNDREVRCMDHLRKLPSRADEDVEDHVIGRRDLSVAVMPRILDQLKQIEACGCM